MAEVFDFLARSLSHDLGPATLGLLERATSRLRFNPDRITADESVVILKERIYPELQSILGAEEAQNKINELLNSLYEKSGGFTAETELRIIDVQLKKFNFYFEWPEVQRLRGLIKVIRREMEAGRDVNDLLWSSWQELDLAEEKLQLALLQQAREISELNSAYRRAQTLGGNQVRRLGVLLEQIENAQKNEILAAAEIERAHKLALDLGKLIESSVVPRSPASATGETPLLETDQEFDLDIDVDFDFLDEEQQHKLLELDVKEDRRLLEQLVVRYQNVITGVLAEDVKYFQAQLAIGRPLGASLIQFSQRVEKAYAGALEQYRDETARLVEQINSLRASGHYSSELDALLEAVQGSLAEGVIPEALDQLRGRIQALQTEAEAAHQAALQHNAILQEEALFIQEAQEVLSRYQGQLKALPEIATFAQGLEQLESSASAGQPDPESLARLRTQFIGLTTILEQAVPDTELLRTRLLTLLRSIPFLESLAVLRNNLENRIIQGPDSDIETDIYNFAQHTREAMKEIVAEIRARAESAGLDLTQIEAAETELAAGGVPDLRLLRARISSQVAGRSAKNQRDLEQLLIRARNFRGIGGERVEEQILAAMSNPDAPVLSPGAIRQELVRLHNQQESLRRELMKRFEALEAGYQAHRVVGGETALSLRERVNYLRQGIERIDRLGVAGLLEIQRGLEESQPLLDRIRDEHQAAKVLAKGLQSLDIDSLLGIFNPEENSSLSGEYLGDDLAFDANIQAGLRVQPHQERLADEDHVRADLYTDLLNPEDKLTTRQLERWEELQLKTSRLRSKIEKAAPLQADEAIRQNFETLKKGLQPGSSRNLNDLERLELLASQIEAMVERIISGSTDESHEASTEVLSFYEGSHEIPPDIQRIFTRLAASGATTTTLVQNWQRVVGSLAIPLGSLTKLFDLGGQIGFTLHKGDVSYISLSYGSRILVALAFDQHALVYTCDPKLEARLLEEAKSQLPMLHRALS